MNLLPNASSKIAFFVCLAFIAVGIYFLLFSYDKETGYGMIAIGVIPMLVIFIKNYNRRPRQ